MNTATRCKHSPEILAYIAGFTDGEGSIFIGRHKLNSKSGNYYYSLQVYVSNSNREVIKWIIELFEASDNLRGYSNRKRWPDHYRVSYHAFFTGIKGKIFLEAIYPFLRVKKEQALLAIEFQNRKSERGRTGKALSPEENTIREEYRTRIQALNKAGTLVGTVRSSND